MANPIWEYLKEKLFNKKQSELNTMSKQYYEELYDPLNNYEWVDNVNKRQREYVKRKI